MFLLPMLFSNWLKEEVIVWVVGGNVAVEGKHKKRQDEHGFISRQFVRKHLVPEQCNVNQLKSSLSSDEVLMITAPRKELNLQSKNERIIKVQIIGQPALTKNSNLAEIQKKNQVQKNSVPQRRQEHTVKVA